MDTSKNGDFLRYGDVNVALANDFGLMKFWASLAASASSVMRPPLRPLGVGCIDSRPVGIQSSMGRKRADLPDWTVGFLGSPDGPRERE